MQLSLSVHIVSIGTSECKWIQYAAAAAAAKSLQSCPTLCDPIDGSPPGSPIPGILQARTLEWVAISFSNAWKWKVKVKSLSRVWLFGTPWTAAHQGSSVHGIFQARVLERGAIVVAIFDQCWHMAEKVSSVASLELLLNILKRHSPFFPLDENKKVSEFGNCCQPSSYESSQPQNKANMWEGKSQDNFRKNITTVCRHWFQVALDSNSLKCDLGSQAEIEVGEWWWEHQILATRPVVSDKVPDSLAFWKRIPSKTEIEKQVKSLLGEKEWLSITCG